MAGFTRKVHMTSQFDYGSIDRVAPDLAIRGPAQGNGGGQVTPDALWFADPDGEVHVYVFSEEARQALIRKLTGGLVVPKGRVP
jgi:hypothetical protein